MKDLVTIKTDAFPANLVVAKSYLESNGISCLLRGDEFTVEANVAEGAQLCVNNADMEKAIALLIEGGFAGVEDFE